MLYMVYMFLFSTKGEHDLALKTLLVLNSRVSMFGIKVSVYKQYIKCISNTCCHAHCPCKSCNKLSIAYITPLNCKLQQRTLTLAILIVFQAHFKEYLTIVQNSLADFFTCSKIAISICNWNTHTHSNCCHWWHFNWNWAAINQSAANPHSSEQHNEYWMNLPQSYARLSCVNWKLIGSSQLWLLGRIEEREREREMASNLKMKFLGKHNYCFHKSNISEMPKSKETA